MHRVAVISGVASGIGREVAIQLSLCGFVVYGIDLHPCKDSDIHSLICDISNEEEVKNAVSSITEKEQSIDVLINAAGIISIHKCYSASEIPTDEWRRVIDVNLNGTFYLTHYMLPYVAEGGCIVNLSTEQVVRPNVKSAPYAVSKAGIEMMTRIFAIDLAKRHIRINTIALGAVHTDFIRHMTDSEQSFKEKLEKADQMMPFGIIKTEDVWKAIRFVIFDAAHLTGQAVLIDSGMTL